MEQRTEVLFEEILEIADASTNDKGAQRAKLRVDARKWYLSKLKPKKYGKQMQLEHSGGLSHEHVLVYVPDNSRTDPKNRITSGNGKT